MKNSKFVPNSTWVYCLSGLHGLHRLRIVHHDLKIENIMMEKVFDLKKEQDKLLWRKLWENLMPNEQDEYRQHALIEASQYIVQCRLIDYGSAGPIGKSSVNGSANAAPEIFLLGDFIRLTHLAAILLSRPLTYILLVL
ncbi:MAG: hypothetical protein LBR92_01260 [Puniceicoccales bacterium]|nr:hypothetical protein [Puniceicoccales bacterium]